MTLPKRIVVVDDEPELRRFLRYLLEDDDRVVIVGEASDGLGGIAVARKTRPDVVLLDLAMPKMRGMDAIPRIREACPGARIVVVSTSPRGEQGNEALRRGADDYLEKVTAADPERILSAILGTGVTSWA